MSITWPDRSWLIGWLRPYECVTSLVIGAVKTRFPKAGKGRYKLHVFKRDRDAIILQNAYFRLLFLGLEILAAADMIRTVALAPAFTAVGALVLVRTFTGWTLAPEIGGRWPGNR
jgi:uncharacterized membrane protein